MYIEREIKSKFEKNEKIYGAIALVGVRQSGKTTFLKEEAKKIKSIFLSFDDPDVRNLFDDDIKKFEKQFIEGNELTVLDEVQYCKDAGINLKYLIDKGRKIWITSSSEIILSKEILSFLVGRISIIRLFPFSLREFLKANNQKEYSKEILQRNIWEHMTFGGYPKVVITQNIEDKKQILKDLFETMILKDIAKTFSIDDINSLEEFVKYLSINSGSLISFDKVSNDINISFQTVKKYLMAMEKSYLIVKVKPFYRNKLKEITKQYKIYFLDTGMMNLISKNFNIEIEGKVFENYVLTELIKAGYIPKYWRNKAKAEVDFVIEKNNEVIPIEVKINANSGKIERSFRSFIEEYKPKRAFVISYKGVDKTEMIRECKIIFTNVLEMVDYLNR